MTEQSRIETDLAQTRTRMSGRLDALQERLTLRRLAEDLMTYVQGSDGGEFTRNLLTSAKNNPVPAAVAGIGLAWLMAATARGPQAPMVAVRPMRPSTPDWASMEDFDSHIRHSEHAVGRRDDDDDVGYMDRLHSVRGKALGVMRSANDTGESYASRVADAVKATKDRIAQTAQDARDGMSGLQQSVGDSATSLQRNVSDAAGAAKDQLTAGSETLRRAGQDMFSTVVESPFMLGAIGLGLGALIATFIPTTESEETALGAMAAQARGALKDAAQDALDRGGDVVQSLVKTGQDSAKTHGLMGDKSLADLAHDAGDGTLTSALSDVAKDALKAGDDALRRP